MLTFTPKGGFEITSGGIVLGEIDVKDGRYVFWPNVDDGGYWSDYILKEICDELIELNANIDNTLYNHPENDL